MHVLEKLWKAAYVFHAEGSLEADLWVLDRTLRILFGEVGQVVKGIRQSITKRGLSGPKRKTLHAVANYLYRNRSRMRYDEYLANGWPIASGPVEGACKNLIKDRMERSGMRWTERMAEAIVQLRAVYLSGDFDAYWQFHIDQDQRRLYPLGPSFQIATPQLHPSIDNRDTNPTGLSCGRFFAELGQRTNGLWHSMGCDERVFHKKQPLAALLELPPQKHVRIWDAIAYGCLADPLPLRKGPRWEVWPTSTDRLLAR